MCHLLRDHAVDEITNWGDGGMFYNPATRKLFELAKEQAMTVGKGHVYWQDVLEALKVQGKHTPQIQEFITSLHDADLAGAPSLDYIFDTLKKHTIRRQTILHLHNSYCQALDAKSDVETVVAETEEALLNIDRQARGKIEVVLPEALVERRKSGLVNRMNTRPVFTGWAEFDKYLNHGFSPGKLSIIAGRTSMGKSFFKTNLIINMANAKVGVLNICPEQGFDSEHDRIDAIMTGVHLRMMTRVREMQATESHKLQVLKKNSERIAREWNYACVPTRGITVAGVQAAIRRSKRGGVCPQVVFIDLFDRLDDVNVARDRAGTMSAKLNQVEKISQEEGVHICLLVQVNRGPEGRKEKRPEMSDLRDCGNFEQDADLIFLLYREGYYNNAIEDNLLEVEVAKQRDGVAGICFQFGIADKHTLSIFPLGEKRRAQETEGGK